MAASLPDQVDGLMAFPMPEMGRSVRWIVAGKAATGRRSDADRGGESGLPLQPFSKGICTELILRRFLSCYGHRRRRGLMREERTIQNSSFKNLFSNDSSEVDAPIAGLLNAFALSLVFWSMTASAVLLIAD